MKDKFFNNIKNLQQRIISFNDVMILVMYLTIVSLSLQNNKLFLEELILCGVIVILCLLNGQNKKK